MTIDQGQTKLANMALTAIGLERIVNMDQENDSASYMKDYYPIVLRRILSERDWNFARRTVDLSGVIPIDEYKNYKYTFSLPEDYVAARRVRPEQYYEIYDNTTLRCNEVASKIVESVDPADYNKIIKKAVNFVELTYTKVTEDPMTFNPAFFQYFAYSLASEVAFMLTGDQGVVASVIGLNNSFQTIAYVEDSNRSRFKNDGKEMPWHMNRRDALAYKYRDGGPRGTEDFNQ